MKKDIKKSLILNYDAIKRLMTKVDNILISKKEFEEWLTNEYKLLKEKETKKSIIFRYASLSKLMKVVNIEQINNNNKFKEWFNYKFEIEREEELFLKNLIKENKIYLANYNEQTLIVKFIGRILNKIKFSNKYVKDWYGYKIACILNGYFLSGELDFIVAKGIETPETPYFFMQEYKKAVNPTGNPEYQVLAAMLTAITLNNTNIIRGGYIIGQYWKFMIMKKLENGNYEYFVSKGFDCLDFDELKKIYIYLQTVKHLYCK